MENSLINRAKRVDSRVVISMLILWKVRVGNLNNTECRAW